MSQLDLLKHEAPSSEVDVEPSLESGLSAELEAAVDAACYGWRIGPCPLCGVHTAYDGPHYSKRAAGWLCPGLTPDEIERRESPRRPPRGQHA